MTTKVTFIAYYKDYDNEYHCYRIAFRNVKYISDILQIAKDEFFEKIIIDRVVAIYVWQQEYYRCEIERL